MYILNKGNHFSKIKTKSCTKADETFKIFSKHEVLFYVVFFLLIIHSIKHLVMFRKYLFPEKDGHIRLDQRIKISNRK